MPSKVGIDSVVLGKKMKMGKNNDNNDNNNDYGQIMIREAHLRLWLRWAKNWLMNYRYQKISLKPRLTLVFKGWQILCYPLVQSIIIILYCMLICPHYVLFQNNPSQVNIWVCISNAHTTPVRIYGEPYVHKFCVVDFIWNSTRRQAISPVAKFYHVLGRGFMILWVVLFFI